MNKLVISLSDAATWFDDMSDAQQREYLKEHPNSKFAHHVVRHVKTLVKHAKKAPEIAKTVHKAVQAWNEEETAELKKFFKTGQDKPDSEVRRSWGKAIADKTKGFVKHLGNDLKEHAHAVRALANMPVQKGGWDNLGDHDKKMLKILGKNLAIFAGGLIASGGVGAIAHAAASHGAGTALQHLAMDYLKEMTVSSLARSAAFASDEPSDAEMIEKFAHGFAKYIQNGDADFKSAFNKARIGV